MTAAGERRGVLLGIDVGKARIGVAACDADHLLAYPVETVQRTDDGSWVERIAEIAEEYGAVGLVCGLPINLRGGDTQSTDDARDVCQQLVERTGIAAHLVDERLTTNVAARQLRPSGRKRGKQRSVIDQAAAVAILQQALEIEQHTGRLPGDAVERNDA